MSKTALKKSTVREKLKNLDGFENIGETGGKITVYVKKHECDCINNCPSEYVGKIDFKISGTNTVARATVKKKEEEPALA